MSRTVLPRQLVKLHSDLPRKSMRRLTLARENGNDRELSILWSLRLGIKRIPFYSLYWVGAGDRFRQFRAFSNRKRKTKLTPRSILVPNQSRPKPSAAIRSAPKM